jgi:hypothetical protein
MTAREQILELLAEIDVHAGDNTRLLTRAIRSRLVEVPLPNPYAPIRTNIDSKYCAEDGRVVKKKNGEALPADEPLFLFRARDPMALPALLTYRDECSAWGCTIGHILGVTERIREFERFRIRHQDRMREPGISAGR